MSKEAARNAREICFKSMIITGIMSSVSSAVLSNTPTSLLLNTSTKKT